MLQQVINNRWFAIVKLLLVVVCGIVWILIPKFGLSFTLLALLPSGLRLLVGKPPFQRTPFDWLIAIFLITAWVGNWAAYDKADAWIKFWLIVTAVLLYFALCNQPRQNLGLLSAVSFFLSFGISSYFFLTNDFSINSGTLAHWWMSNRPQIGWTAIHHGYISGLLVITSLIAVYWLWNVRKQSFGHFGIAVKLIVILAAASVAWAFILTMSRGIWAAVVCGVGVWLLWKITISNRFARVKGLSSLFPVFTLIYLGTIIIYVYLGPARAGGETSQSDYGKNTRAELQSRGTYFLADYPITGGGLNSFPGLYSQYVIVIPFFYFVNSYNLFLDVGIEQGIVGGLAFLFIYLGSVWIISQKIVKSQSHQTQFISWICLLTLIVIIVHGLFYDYLYHGGVTMLLLAPVGFSMAVLNAKESGDVDLPLTGTSSILKRKNIRTLIYALILGGVVIVVFNTGTIKSIWYANLGAVQMSRAELQNFPANKWIGTEIVPALETAETSLRIAHQYNPANPTANYRLGMISMLRQDYESSVGYLEIAHKGMPKHRGIIKSLGYSYVWLGDMERAQPFLAEIPEAGDELSVYTWWWGTQGRNDLSENAASALMALKDTPYSP